MIERRKEERIEEENELIITVESAENDPSEAKIRDVYLNNYTKNISKSGLGIRTEVQLPVDALIELEFKSKGLGEQIKAFGKVKWVRVAIQDQAYEAGVEFSGLPEEAVKKLEDYISWKLKDKLKKKEPTPLDSDFVRDDVNKKQETQTTQPVKPTNEKQKDAGKQKSAKAGDIPPSKKKVRHKADHEQTMRIVMISLCAIIAAASLFVVSSHFSEFSQMIGPELTKMTSELFGRPSTDEVAIKRPATPPPTTEKTAKPEPASSDATQNPAAPANTIVAIAPPTAQGPPASAKTTAPAVETKTFKVIGNRDTKRYHLPGMKYYNAVKAYHRVEFDSEADAIAAGYHKAPQ